MISPLLAMLVMGVGAPSLGPIGKLTNVVVSSARFDKMRLFYEGVMGLSPFFQDATSSFYKAGGVNLVLVRLKSRPGKPREKVCLDFGVPDLGAAAERLQEATVHIESRTKDLIQFRDPDGNVIELVKG